MSNIKVALICRLKSFHIDSILGDQYEAIYEAVPFIYEEMTDQLLAKPYNICKHPSIYNLCYELSTIVLRYTTRIGHIDNDNFEIYSSDSIPKARSNEIIRYIGRSKKVPESFLVCGISSIKERATLSTLNNDPSNYYIITFEKFIDKYESEDFLFNTRSFYLNYNPVIFDVICTRNSIPNPKEFQTCFHMIKAAVFDDRVIIISLYCEHCSDIHFISYNFNNIQEDSIEVPSNSNSYFGSKFSDHFTIKDIKLICHKTIVTWEDDTTTTVSMQDDESKYDFDKAIMAAYMKQVVDLMEDPKKRSLDDIFEKWTKVYKKHEKELKSQLTIRKIKRTNRRNKKNKSE